MTTPDTAATGPSQPTGYERITANVDGTRVTKRCKVLSETELTILADILDADWNVGTGKLDSEGREIHQQWLLSKDLIVNRVPMRQNLTYGTWEPSDG